MRKTRVRVVPKGAVRSLTGAGLTPKSSLMISVGLHLLLAIGFVAAGWFGRPTTKVIVPTPSLEIISARAVDGSVLEQAAADKAAREAALREAEAERQARAEAERRAAEQRRQAAEAEAVRLAKVKKAKLEAEAKARREAEAKAKREAEANARREAEARAKREAEAIARREAEEKVRREAELKAAMQAEEQARREAEAKARREAEEQARREAEAKARREAEAAAAAKAQALADQTEIGRYLAALTNRVEQNFMYPNLKQGLKCTLYVKMLPGGEVIDVRVTEASGDPGFDRQAMIAVRKAAPLPVPKERRLFDKMREIQFIFNP